MRRMFRWMGDKMDRFSESDTYNIISSVTDFYFSVLIWFVVLVPLALFIAVVVLGGVWVLTWLMWNLSWAWLQ